MKKYLIGKTRKEIEEYTTSTFTAEEDIMWYRLDCLLGEQDDNMLREIRDIINKAKEDGVVFLESGLPDIDGSNKEALDKCNERINVIRNEEVNTRLLPISMLHKLKVENNLASGKYNYLLQIFLKED